MDEQPAQLAQALESTGALRAEYSDSAQRGEIAAGVELVATATDLGELKTEAGQLSDVVVELVDAALDRLDPVERNGFFGVVGGAEGV